MGEWLAKMADAFERVLPAKLRAAMTRLSTRLTIAMVAMVVITAAVIEIVIFHGIESALLPRERERIDAQVRLLAADFDSYVGGARADVRSFIAAAALDGIIRARQNGGIHPDDGTSEMIWRRRLAERLVAEVKAKPLYQQFRIIGFADGGLELVRVDRSGPGNTVRAVPADELQRKGDTDYLKAIAKTRQGELFISKINYNREYEKIKLPPVPVLRVASPLFTDRGVLFGALIINMDMRPIFARIRGSQATGEGVFVVNENGDYLLNPDRVKEFGFEYGAPRRVQDDYPVFGSLLTSDGVWEDTFSGPTGRDLVAAGVRVKFGENAGVAIAKVVPYSNIMAPIWSIGYSALLGGLAIAIGAVILAIVIAGSLTRPLRQMITAVKAFGRNEPMTVPLAAGGEIGLLARAFERMVVDIGEKTSQLDRGTEERRHIFESSIDLIIVVDRSGMVIQASPSALTILGYQPEEMIDHNAGEFLHPADLERTRTRMRQLRRGRKMQNYEVGYLHKDGRTVTMAWAGVWSDPARKYFFIGRDVTEQRSAEELFRLAVETSPSGMLMVDRSGRILMVNSELEQLFGYRRDELLGRPIEMLVPIDFRDEHRKLRGDYLRRATRRNMAEGKQLSGLRKDGSQFPFEIGLNPINIRDGLVILGVVVDISEKLRNERLKDEFVSTVSHELRTPLTSITASLALLSAGRAGVIPETASRLVSIAHSNGQRLVRLINDILDIEKIESGKMSLTIKSVNAMAVVKQVIEASKDYADECGVGLKIEGLIRACDVRADSDRLAQVVTNLLSNAIKFSPRGKDVTVAVNEHDGLIRISVRDHGPGVPDKFKTNIFGKFAQADSSDAREKGGTGLGLSIVKQIVDRLGGDVGYESGPGRGSMFYVDLPRWHDAADRAGGGNGRGGLILLCEEDANFASMLCAKIARAGFSVHVATTESDALQQADIVTYAAVLVGLQLSEGNSVDLIQALRSRPRFRDTPFVMISRHPGDADGSRAAALHILDWLDKPIDIDHLLRTLERAISQSDNGFPRLLHIDADDESRKTVADAMRRLAQVVSVATLAEAGAAAVKRPFDLVVLDAALTASSGPAILPELRDLHGTPVPVVLFSAQGANMEYASRFGEALAQTGNSIDYLIEILLRSLGTPDARSRKSVSGPGGPAFDASRSEEVA